MKTLRLLMMFVVSLFFLVTLRSTAWSGPPQFEQGTLFINLECRNPSTSQDIAKTPIIRNTTENWLAKGTKILWTASDGDQGTIILQNSLEPGGHGEVQGVGKPGQVYTCTAKAVRKLQSTDAELEIKNVNIINKDACMNQTYQAIVRVANNGGGPTKFKFKSGPYPQNITYNINANQEVDFQTYGTASAVITNNSHISLLYLDNSLEDNPLCNKYSGKSGKYETFCDSNVPNHIVEVSIPHRSKPPLCKEDSLVIRSPKGAISSQHDSFSLEIITSVVDGTGNVSEGLPNFLPGLDIEWARVEEPNWISNTPASAPKNINVDDLPVQIQIGNVFLPGQYAVRAKAHGGNTWSEWQRFVIGSISKDALGKQKITPLQGTTIQGKNALQETSGIEKVTPGGTMKPMSGQGPEGLGGLSEKKAPLAKEALTTAKRPDLVVDKFWVETVQPGEKMLNGQIADKKYLYFTWKVRNIGDKISAPTKLNIGCVVIMGQGPCPLGPMANYDVKQLWPKPNSPNDPAGGQVFWNQQPFPAPASQVKYRFTAIVDPNKKIDEKNESNNKLVSVFDTTPKLIKHTEGMKPVIKPEQNKSLQPEQRKKDLRETPLQPMKR